PWPRQRGRGVAGARPAGRPAPPPAGGGVGALPRLELVIEAVRAALEELARTADHALEGLVDDDWGRRYGRPVRLGKNPTRPKTRMNEAGADARRLIEHLAARHPDLLSRPQLEAPPPVLPLGLRGAPALARR